MLFEIHAHTSRHSNCSQIDPVTLVKRIINKGLQGLIITEHHYLWNEEEINRLRIDAGADKWFIILSAQEVETDIGHVLVYGADKSIEGRTAVKDLRKSFPGAALVWAHPFRRGSKPSDSALASPLLDGIEIFSLNHSAKENYAALKAWHELKFTALSGSDTHSEENAGLLPTQFDHDVRTLKDAVTEMKKGRVRPFFKEIPKAGSDLTVTEITLGTKGGDEVRQRIIVKSIMSKRKWDNAKGTAELVRNICDSGFNNAAFRVPKIIDISDSDNTIIEEGQRGKNLYDTLMTVAPEAGKPYFELAGKWLAKFHSLRLGGTPFKSAAARENKKLLAYADNLKNTGNSDLIQALKILDFVNKAEKDIFDAGTASFVLNHGDYHPKNIIIGSDKANDPGTLYISVIDFANSFYFLPAFDVGYFLAQFAGQFHERPDILKSYDEDAFLQAYSGGAKNLSGEFLKQTGVFKLRANLSIANYLIRVGKGESAEFHDLIKRSVAIMKDLY